MFLLNNNIEVKMYLISHFNKFLLDLFYLFPDFNILGFLFNLDYDSFDQNIFQSVNKRLNRFLIYFVGLFASSLDMSDLFINYFTYCKVFFVCEINSSQSNLIPALLD